MDTHRSDLELLRKTYLAFNARDIDAVLATMLPDVEWPDGLKGGYLDDREAVREYWTRQWSQFDPSVEPVEFEEKGDLGILVKVHQVVHDSSGAIILDQYAGHRYMLENGPIRTMEILPPFPE